MNLNSLSQINFMLFNSFKLYCNLNISIFKLPFSYFFPRRESVILGEDFQIAVLVQFWECVLVLAGISTFHPLIWRFLILQPDIHLDSASSLGFGSFQWNISWSQPSHTSSPLSFQPGVYQFWFPRRSWWPVLCPSLFLDWFLCVRPLIWCQCQ